MRVIAIALLSLTVVGCRSDELPADRMPPREAAGLEAPSREPSPVSETGATLQSHVIDGVDVELIVIDVGLGDTIQVRWRYLNHTAEERILAGGVDHPDAEFLLTREAFLVDEVHKKKYLIVVDENDRPVASRHGGPSWVAIGPGETINAWAKFPAPPADAERVSVHIPGVPPFEDVAIPETTSAQP